MRGLQRPAPLYGGFLQQKRGQAPVQALPHDLLDQPHHIGKPGRHQLVGEVGRRCGFLHDPAVHFRGDDPELGVLFRFDRHLKLGRAHHAGGGKQADIPVEQPVEGDLPPFVRKDEGAQLAGLYHQQAGAVHAAVVEHGPFLYAPGHGRAAQAALLGGGEFVPDRKISFKRHGVHLLFLCARSSGSIIKGNAAQVNTGAGDPFTKSLHCRFGKTLTFPPARDIIKTGRRERPG